MKMSVELTINLPELLSQQTEAFATQRGETISEVVQEALETFIAGTTTDEHICIGADGTPVIAGTTMKVIELVTAQMAYGWSPEELHFQHPYLSLGQIHSALAYYWDHRAEFDVEIERRRQWAEDMRKESGPSPLAAKLRAQEILM
jgi:uncharacterized protein (DUF433 family)